MMLYRPRFRYPDEATKPANLAEAEELLPILNPVASDQADLALDVETLSGEVLAIDDPPCCGNWARGPARVIR